MDTIKRENKNPIQWFKDLFGREVLKKKIPTEKFGVGIPTPNQVSPPAPPAPPEYKKREVGYIVTLLDGVTQHYTEYPRSVEEETSIRAQIINKIEEFRKTACSTADEYIGIEGFVFKRANFKNISMFIRDKKEEK